MKGYKKYLGKKLFWYIITMFFAVFCNFLLPRMIPGNPIMKLVADATSGVVDASTIKKAYDSYMAMFGLDKPLLTQFFIYIKNIFHGDFGVSFSRYPRPVIEFIKESLPWTLGLQIPAILVGWFFGNALGAQAAYRKGIFDKALFPVFLFMSAIPPFGFAILSVFFLAVKLHWFPLGLGYAFDLLPGWSPAFILSVLNHYRLPFLSMVFVTIGTSSLGMREMSIYELNTDYVKYSRLMGIKDSKIVSYVFRNAMLPQITGLGVQLGTMVAGNLIVEIVFSYPGIGTTLFMAIRNQDFSLISGCTLIITFFVLIANFIVDIICGIIDPRVKAAEQEGN